MNPERSKLRYEHEAEQTQAVQQVSSETQTREFATVDELLRHDSEQHPVPPGVAQRVNASIAAEPKPERSWFKKLFGS